VNKHDLRAADSVLELLERLSVRKTLTRKRRREKSTDEYLAICARMLRAAVPRDSEADEYELRKLYEIREVVDTVNREAVHGQRRAGRSWAYIGDALGIARQTAHEKWGKKP